MLFLSISELLADLVERFLPAQRCVKSNQVLILARRDHLRCEQIELCVVNEEHFGHAIATCLRWLFAKLDLFRRFLSYCLIHKAGIDGPVFKGILRVASAVLKRITHVSLLLGPRSLIIVRVDAD